MRSMARTIARRSCAPGGGIARSIAADAAARLFDLVIDPTTEQGVPDPSWFGAAYYAVTCTTTLKARRREEMPGDHRRSEGLCRTRAPA